MRIFNRSWRFIFNMIWRRRRMKYLVLGSPFIFLFIYLLMWSYSYEAFPSGVHSHNLQDIGKRNFGIPDEGPVEDLLGLDRLKPLENDKLDKAKDVYDPFEDDPPGGIKPGQWGKGFRVKPGFNNPLKRKTQRPQKEIDAEIEREAGEGIVDQLGEDQHTNPRLLVPVQADIRNFMGQMADKLLLDKDGDDEDIDFPHGPNDDMWFKLQSKPEPDNGHKVQHENQPAPPPELIFSPHKDRPNVSSDVEDVKEKDGDEGCFEVSKDKTYDNVKFPVFIDYGGPDDPGENGKKFIFHKTDLTIEERRQKEKDFDDHYFDEWASRRIAVHRYLPDNRPDLCKQQTFSSLPATSVLIVFHNEAWTTLLRTIHSILDRTPDELLLEIVLLDDFSDMDHLKEPLEVYLKPLAKVRLLRAKERLGLIRARNMVFDHSRGDIVVFLDSHIECFPGWLEPLIGPIHYDSKTVTFPVIEFINPKTFAVGINQRVSAAGGLKLSSLTFNWLYQRPNTKSMKPSDNRPSPTMPGGLYAISRDYFKKLGQYDPGMDYWGGENIEISFKAWMCGGSILLVGCSHIGHVFRTKNPALKGVIVGYKNSIRVAEVWMDSYKHFFYEKIAYSIHNFGDVSERVKLRKSLQCRDFAWYLQYVFPELKQEMDVNNIYGGQIWDDESQLCIDRQQESHLSIQPCKDSSMYQHWNLLSNGTLLSIERVVGLRRFQSHGLDRFSLGVFMTSKLTDNVNDTLWTYDNQRRLVHKNTGMCLQAQPKQREAILQTCSTQNKAQRWKVQTRKERQEMFKNKGLPIDWTV